MIHEVHRQGAACTVGDSDDKPALRRQRDVSDAKSLGSVRIPQPAIRPQQVDCSSFEALHVEASQELISAFRWDASLHKDCIIKGGGCVLRV